MYTNVNMKVKKAWHVISIKWLTSWKIYTNYERVCRIRGAIANNVLVEAASSSDEGSLTGAMTAASSGAEDIDKSQN
jgi:hypothetical protein